MSEQKAPAKIGLWTSTSLVIGNMIGSGVFLLPASLAAFGGISLFGWIGSSLGAIVLALLFSKLSKMLKNTVGGPYAYTRDGLGDFAAFLVAWGYWISIWCTNAAITVALISYLTVFFPALSGDIQVPVHLDGIGASAFSFVPKVPAELPILVSDSVTVMVGIENPHAIHTRTAKGSALLAVLTGLGIIWLLTWVNTRGVKSAGVIQVVTTILKILPLLAVSFVGLFYVSMDNFMPFNMTGGSNFAAISATITLTLFAFLGLESATIPSGDIHEPEKTIPRATMIGTLVTILIYVMGSFAVMGMIPAEILKDSNAPFADAAAIMWGPNARYWIAAGAVISTFGALNGWILLQGQMPMAAARDKLFPGIFKKENSKRTPAHGIVISSILISALLMMNFTKGLTDTFTFMVLLTTLTVLVPYIFSASAYGVLLLQNKYWKKDSVSNLIIAGLAFLFSLWAILGSGAETVYWGFIAILAGIPFYVWMKRKQD